MLSVPRLRSSGGSSDVSLSAGFGSTVGGSAELRREDMIPALHSPQRQQEAPQVCKPTAVALPSCCEPDHPRTEKLQRGVAASFLVRGRLSCRSSDLQCVQP